ncbi:hypothetical protein V2J09_011257 [Rumex salicifolius]
MLSCVNEAFGIAGAFAVLFILWKLLFSCYLKPMMALKNLKNHGFTGPTPSFPLGNLLSMKNKIKEEEEDVVNGASSPKISHDIHSTSFPYFASWQRSHGKVFVYWMGTEPFVYVADAGFLKEVAEGVAGKSWGKPAVFQSDREALFGRFGLSVIEGDDWVRHRHIITPAFSSSSLKVMTNSMVECTNKLVNQWKPLIGSSKKMEIDIEQEISSLSGKIIAVTNFGLENERGNYVYTKLRATQDALFKHWRYLGVPFGKLLCMKQTLEARKLGKEVDQLLLSIISARRKVIGVEPQRDLLGILLEEADMNRNKYAKSLTTREIIDECKTFFFGGNETVALAMSWTLMLLALNPKWQQELREEIKQVVGDKEIDYTILAGLKKMGWVMKEVLRLYPSSPNAQRQAKTDIRAGKTVIPKGTNMWIDVVSMHHDPSLWGDDVNDFKPERFQHDPIHGGCRLKTGYMPFGFGGRMCIGRNYTVLEYKIVLSILLSQFSFSVSPAYRHCPMHFFSFRPRYGITLVVQELI